MAHGDGNIEPGPEGPPHDVAQPAELTAAARRRRNGLVAGIVAAVIVVAIPVVVLQISGSDSGGHGPSVNGDPRHVVLAAAGATAAAGRYDITFTDHVTARDDPGPCTAAPLPTATNAGVNGVLCVSSGIQPRVDISGHGTVNLDPYASVSVANVSGLGEITTYIDGTTVWELGGGGYGQSAGSPLSGFAGSVEGTLGPGEGAVTMITLASRGGYLGLEEAAVQHATPAGTGTIDGATLTYYDITIDVTKLADATDLTGEERATITAALPLLRSAGYTGTEERIGIDAAGFIRDVTATERFADGSTMSRRTLLSNFGCAPAVTMPDQPAPPPTTAPCQSPDTTTLPTSSSTAPAAPPTTTAGATSSTTTASTTTTTSSGSTSTSEPGPSSTATTSTGG